MKHVAKLDEQRRIYLDPSLIESTLGLVLSKGDSGRLWALIGARRQLQVLAPQNELARARDRLEDGSLFDNPTWDSSNDEGTGLIRRIISFVGISCAHEPKRNKLTLTVDAEAERLELIRRNAQIVVFASGKILELWRHDIWVENSITIDPRMLEAEVKAAFGEGS